MLLRPGPATTAGPPPATPETDQGAPPRPVAPSAAGTTITDRLQAIGRTLTGPARRRLWPDAVVDPVEQSVRRAARRSDATPAGHRTLTDAGGGDPVPVVDSPPRPRSSVDRAGHEGDGASRLDRLIELAVLSDAGDLRAATALQHWMYEDPAMRRTWLRLEHTHHLVRVDPPRR